ncbi:MAG: type IV toxin-antitoxin system AbiEi family antitoxin domain-containing protein [Promethearchaeia archaeon]
MSLTEQIYFEMLDEEVVTLDRTHQIAKQIIDKSINRKQLRQNYLYPLQQTGKLRSIRRGLYHAIIPSRNEIRSIPDPLLIGYAVRPDGFLGYHTALEYYGLGHSLYYRDVYVCVDAENKRFRPFEYSKRRYRPVVVEDTDSFIINTRRGTRNVRVSSRERTFVDCVDRTEYAGGWHELLFSLLGMKLDPRKLLDVLEHRDNQYLIRRVGFVLDVLRKHSSAYSVFDGATMDRFIELVDGAPRYLLRDSESSDAFGGDAELNRRWLLYVPTGFESHYFQVI